MNDLLFKPDRGLDFISPASQSVVADRKRPLWEVDYSSRAIKYPFWDRPEVFRTVNFWDTSRIVFSEPEIEDSASNITPSGLLNLNTYKLPFSLTISDRELYDMDVQRAFALFMQFDTLLEHQIAAFLGLSLERTQEILEILYLSRVIYRNRYKWRNENYLGPIWRLNLFTNNARGYLNGMDAINRLFAFGDFSFKDIPPGSSSPSTVKHNLFAAETMLRIAEVSDNVIGVWGDLFASESMFHDQDANAKQRNSHGDMIAVTANGSIIIFELVGSVHNSRSSFKKVVDKAASWVGVIANSDLDINVIFLDTTWQNSSKDTFNAVDIGIQKESVKYSPNNFLRERALSHIGVVDATWWFPENNSVSKAATRLCGYSPYLKKYKCFDEPDSGYSNEENRRNVTINTVTALHNPYWIHYKVKHRVYN